MTESGADRLVRSLQRRIYFAGFFALIWAGSIVFRLVDLQILRTGDLVLKAQRQNQRIIQVDAKRGLILDRNGHELAISRDLESCYAVPSEIDDPQLAARRLSQALDDPSLRVELTERFASKRSFVWVKRRLDRADADAVRALGLKGVGFVPESKRFDPKAELASHVLGYVGDENKGLAGLEYKYDPELSGTPGRVLIELDARKREYAYTVLEPTRPGRNLVLTIDEVIQFIAESELRQAVARHRARGGSVIVMSPRTGEILAMANWPTFDPNEFGDSAAANRRNRAIQDIYEPGSTFKILIAAATLQEHTATINERFDCQMGAIEIAGHRIRDHKPFGVLTMDQIIEHSSNVGSIKLGLRLGSERLYRYMRLFGFGQVTAVGLPGESPGLLREPKDWSAISIGALCMGQEVGVTPMQMLQTTATIANHGVMIRPRIVRQIVSPDGQTWEAPSALPPARLVQPEVAGQVRDILEDVVVSGTGIAARMDGFSTAGKTGTAQKVDARTGRYAPGRYISSFVGFTPIDNPAIAMIVVIDEPVGSYYGGLVAAPVYKLCAEKILRYLNVFPERRTTVAPQLMYASLSPAVREELAMEEGELLERVAEPVGEAGAPGMSAPAVLMTEDPSPAPRGPVFPDLRGRSLREAARTLAHMGVSFESKGAGYVIAQDPAPSTPLDRVTRCKLVLSIEKR